MNFIDTVNEFKANMVHIGNEITELKRKISMLQNKKVNTKYDFMKEAILQDKALDFLKINMNKVNCVTNRLNKNEKH